MRLRIVHETTYEYAELVTTSHHEIHLAPRDGPGQVCLLHSVDVVPAPAFVRERTDYFENRVGYFSLHEPHRALRVLARSVVRVDERRQSLLFREGPAWEEVRDRVASDRRADLLAAYEFVFSSRYVRVDAGLRDFALPSFQPGRPLLDAIRDLTRRIHSEFTYDQNATQISTPLADVLRQRRGVCQDFAHLQIGCLRSLGLPGRYVSGYLVTKPPPGRPRLVGADASHAWVSAFCPGIGWVDFDPANDVVPTDDHVTVAYGCDFGDVTPVRGVIRGGGRHVLRVAVDVSRVEDDS